MLIIAIPKSASTSLMLTLSKYHGIEAAQDFSFSENPVPEECKVLHKLHSDIRELTNSNVETLKNGSKVYKQHIFPSSNNLGLLSQVKKVVLLRDTSSIVSAYRRGALKKVHNLLPGYSTNMSEADWLRKSKGDGLFSDLEFFKSQWESKAHRDSTLFISYEDYVENAQAVINQVERFFELPTTETEITTVKSRYSRHNVFINLLSRFWKSLKKKLNKLRSNS